MGRSSDLHQLIEFELRPWCVLVNTPRQRTSCSGEADNMLGKVGRIRGTCMSGLGFKINFTPLIIGKESSVQSRCALGQGRPNCVFQSSVVTLQKVSGRYD